MITAIFPIPISCPSSQPRRGWNKSPAAWSNCPWPKSSASCATSNCPPPTPRPLSGTSPLGNYFEALRPAIPRIQKPSPTGSSTTSARKLAETQTTLADLKFKPENILELIALVDAKKSAVPSPSRFSPRCLTPANPPHRIVEKKGLGPSQRHRRHRGLLRPGHLRQPRPRRRFQIRQSRRPEFPQGPGHETEQRQSQPRPHPRNPPAQIEVVPYIAAKQTLGLCSNMTAIAKEIEGQIQHLPLEDMFARHRASYRVHPSERRSPET